MARVLSFPFHIAEAVIVPNSMVATSGLKIGSMRPKVPRNRAMAAAALHTIARVSSDVVAMCFPSGLQHTLLTLPLCPLLNPMSFK
jgi:hypothetical protein